MLHKESGADKTGVRRVRVVERATILERGNRLEGFQVCCSSMRVSCARQPSNDRGRAYKVRTGPPKSSRGVRLGGAKWERGSNLASRRASLTRGPGSSKTWCALPHTPLLVAAGRRIDWMLRGCETSCDGPLRCGAWPSELPRLCRACVRAPNHLGASGEFAQCRKWNRGRGESRPGPMMTTSIMN